MKENTGGVQVNVITKIEERFYITNIEISGRRGRGGCRLQPIGVLEFSRVLVLHITD